MRSAPHMSTGLITISDEDGLGDMSYQPLETRGSDNTKREHEFQTLKWLHFVVSIIFLIEIIVFAALGINNHVQPTVGKPVNCDDGPLCDTQTQRLDNMDLTYLPPLIVAIAYLNHLVSFLQCRFQPDIAKKAMFIATSNPYRWMEYALSTSVMLLTVAIVSGVTDVHLWFLICFSNAIGMGCGLVLEFLPRNERSTMSTVPFKKMREVVFSLGVLAKAAPWLVIACYFFRAVGQNLAIFIYVAFFGTLVMYVAAVGNEFRYGLQGSCDFATAEVHYIWISLLGKTLLAAALCGGFRNYK